MLMQNFEPRSDLLDIKTSWFWFSSVQLLSASYPTYVIMEPKSR